jgi:Uma2 family endonuclease
MPPEIAVRCTPEEYLSLERANEHRSEYVGGVMRPMPPSNACHSLITGSILSHLSRSTRGGPCWVLGVNMRVKVSATGLYVYPDVLAACEPALAEDEHRDTLLNPAMIVEVMSDATEAWDRGDKFRNYRRMESLREYILVDQGQPLVEQYVRSGERWTLRVLEGLAATLAVETLGCTITLAEIYEKVEFPPAGEGNAETDGSRLAREDCAAADDGRDTPLRAPPSHWRGSRVCANIQSAVHPPQSPSTCPAS